MSVASYVFKAPQTVSAEETARAAAQLMEKESIGCVVLVANGRAAGMLTDRDIALRVLRRKLDANVVRVGEIATRPPITIAAHAPLREAADLMREHGIRRLPVVDEAGNLVGLLSADDVLRVLATDVADLAKALRYQLSGGAPDAEGARRHAIG